MIPTNLSPLANHLWQSTLFAAAAWLLTLVLRKNRAAVRYALWLAASGKFLVPFSLLVSTGSQFAWQITSGAAQGPFPLAMKQLSHPFALPAEAAATASSVPVLVFSVWFCGFVISAAVWLWFWLRFRAALQAAVPLHLDLPIPVMTSRTRLEPGVFGIRKPILLLPEGILNRLTPAQLQSILAHELCHVRRRDNLTAAIHMLVESVFWFYPLVWWIGARLVAERERACDEEVVRLGNEPGVYAEGILNVCKFYLQSPLACVSGVTGAELSKRIEAIVNYRISHKLTAARKLLLAAAGVAAVAGPVFIGILSAPQSRAQSKVEGLRFEEVPNPPQPPPRKISGPIIEAIEFRGAERISTSHLRAIIASRAGSAYDIETLRSDSQALYKSGRFSDIHWETEPGRAGVIVRFLFVERPLIESIEYHGDGTVTMPEILERFKQRKITLKPETLYNQDELPRAAVTVQELVAEKGRQNIAVIPLVEPISPSTVKITFRVEEKH